MWRGRLRDEMPLLDWSHGNSVMWFGRPLDTEDVEIVGLRTLAAVRRAITKLNQGEA